MHRLSRSQVGVTHFLHDIIKETSWKTSLQGVCVLAGFSFSFPLSSGTNIPCPEPPFGAERFTIDPKKLMPTSESLGHWNLRITAVCPAGGVFIRVALQVYLCKAVSL